MTVAALASAGLLVALPAQAAQPPVAAGPAEVVGSAVGPVAVDGLNVEVVSGDGQETLAGTVFPDVLVVRVTDDEGLPVPGVDLGSP